MTMQHTPGPWLKDRNIILNAAGEEIARVSYERSGYVQANARLIAESPYLLELLSQVLARLDLEAQERPSMGFPCNAMRDDIRHAIRLVKEED